jgi:putative salt-induced outer membrane protein YdiY
MCFQPGLVPVLKFHGSAGRIHSPPVSPINFPGKKMFANRSRGFRFYPLLCLLAVLPVRLLHADTLLMQDGSRLLGEVVRQQDGTLEFSTSYAGVIKVQWSQVSELQTDKPIEVYLGSGESLQVTTIRNTSQATVLGGVASVREVDPATVAFINPEPWQRGEGMKLSGMLNVGMEFQQGNTDQQKLALDTALKARRKHDRYNLLAQYQKDKSNDITTAQNWQLRNKYDYFVSDKRYYGASLNFEQDKLADLNLRTSLGPHAGYQFFESKQLNLAADISLLYVTQDFDIAADDEYTAMGWSIDFDKLLFADRVQLYHRQNGLLELDDTGNVVVNSWTGLRFPLYAGIVASTEAEVDYDGGAPAGVDEVDTIWRIKLGYQW